jgi:two-component system chemotaxis response regulator CheB
MVNKTEKRVVRVMLAGAEARDRLHLRRIFSGVAGVEVAGHVRQGVPAEDTLKHCMADVMLVDFDDNVAATRDAVSAAARRDLKVLVMATNGASLPQLGIPTTSIISRPANLEQETARSTFGEALQRRVIGIAGLEISADQTERLKTRRPAFWSRPDIIAIGCSTGGPQALPEVLSRIAGRVGQPIVITQHMPPAFTRQLAAHLSRYTARPTVEAADGMPILPGTVYLAAGGHHLLIVRKGEDLICRLDDGEPENFCRPAVDPMLRSIVSVAGGKALAVILTGMGQDGLAGCRRLVEAGGAVIAQDEATSVVWGMPGAVAQAGLCQAIVPLNKIADEIIAAAGTLS